MLGFADGQVKDMMRIVAAVLALGNVAFVAGDGEKHKVKDAKGLGTVASLLMVEPTALEGALTTRKVASGRGSTYTVPLNAQQCIDTRDALAKATYTNLFDWLIAGLNSRMAAQSAKEIDKEDELFVGLLDVFGFENFDFNTFEQLCINYTNEKLQQQFIDALVKLQQQDYEREGIKCAHISFPDNAAQLGMLEAKLGVLGMLDEECALPKGNEEAYVEKMHKQFEASEIYKKPSRGGGGGKRGSVADIGAKKDLDKLQFVITHYAGEVMYTAESWLDKNRGFLQPDLAMLMGTSSSKLVEALFPISAESESKKKSTVSSTFRASLKALSATLLQTSARYIRCIKPNLRVTLGHLPPASNHLPPYSTGTSAASSRTPRSRRASSRASSSRASCGTPASPPSSRSSGAATRSRCSRPTSSRGTAAARSRRPPRSPRSSTPPPSSTI